MSSSADRQRSEGELSIDAVDKVFYAHTGTRADRHDWQSLKDHLHQVARLAADNASTFQAGDWAHIVGLLHDLGKYSKEFQLRLNGSNARADHATAGAKLIVQHVSETMGAHWGPMAKLMAYAIAGHHTGLPNGVDDGQARSSLKQRLSLEFGKNIPGLDPVWRAEISLPQTLKVPALKTHHPPGKYVNFGPGFFTRMLFSCLIDADRIDTENHARHTVGLRPLASRYPTICTLQSQIGRYLAQMSAAAQDTEVNKLRQKILRHACSKADLPPGLFSLTVPTGGGKTLTSLAFGLDHAVKHQKRRLIYVIPFTSIIEQTADVFRKALSENQSAVLEHHSTFDRDKLAGQYEKASASRKADYRDKLRLAMDSWDAPIIVTTAVQFFESLFSDRPSQCRKLHNIAGSVIILDEAQTLPLKLLRPIMAAIDELALNYGCSVVLCTATQPALKESDAFHNGFKDVREIAPHPEELFVKLRRTQVKSLGPQTDEQLVDHLRAREQVLMIVNNRRHARELFDAIAQEPGAYHLTTAMCAEHRSQKLADIRQRLKGGLPCRLVATSLIEAGVDVDFPSVFRAEAGLDSIAQAAGRCNREGRRALENSEVFVFQTPEWKAPPELAQLAAPMRSILRNHAGDVLAPAALKSYFQQVYNDRGSELDGQGILKMHRETKHFDYPFQNIAQAFRMIDSHMLPIIVPFDGTARENLDWLRRLPENMSVSGPSKKLQRYVVQVPERAFGRLVKLGAVVPISPERFGDQFHELVTDSLYSDSAGLNFSDPTALAAEALVI
jgi:CRISPR-associated endonuclease/helicase Cas3